MWCTAILGPLLFLNFINGLQGFLAHTTPNMYAEDTRITKGHENLTLWKIELMKSTKFVYLPEGQSS